MKITQIKTQIAVVLAIFIGLTYCPKTFSASDNESGERLKWDSQTRLSWKDFKGKSNKNSMLAAETNSGIHFSYQCSGNKMDFDIYAYFDKEKSWTKPNSTDVVLNHEQLHFDITELYARKMRQKFLSLRNPCKKSKAELQGVFSALMKEHRTMQNTYDRETNHSLKEKEQAKWQADIESELLKLKEFK